MDIHSVLYNVHNCFGSEKIILDSVSDPKFFSNSDLDTDLDPFYPKFVYMLPLCFHMFSGTFYDKKSFPIEKIRFFLFQVFYLQFFTKI
jgi:glycyl-tRNA synthetase beta subunit